MAFRSSLIILNFCYWIFSPICFFETGIPNKIFLQQSFIGSIIALQIVSAEYEFLLRCILDNSFTLEDTFTSFSQAFC